MSDILHRSRAVAVGLMAVAVVTISDAQAAFASEPSRYSPEFDRCVAAAGDDGLTAELRSCYADEMRLQSAQLQDAHAKLLGRAPASRRAKILASQKAWAAATNKRCMAEDSEGGTLGDFEILSCRLDAVIARRLFISRR